MKRQLEKKVNFKQKFIVCGILLIVILIIIIGLLIGRITELKQSPIIITDTITNTVEIEKIKIEIKEKEEEIEHYKEEYKYEKEQATIINDSSAIKLFYQLVWE